MAGVMISQEDLTPEQVSCIFTASEEFLPAQLVECSEPPSSMLAVSFLGSSADLSGNDVDGRVALGGEAQVTSSGAQFETYRDYITVLDFDYETGDGTFTVSFWMTKEECTDSVYEYLYSHMSSTSAATMWSTSSLNIYLGCEEANGGFSTLAGGQGATSIMRYNIYDVTGKTAMFDYALHEAGDFDAITNVWVHTVFTVTRTALVTYDDGMRVNDIGCNVQTAGDGTTACPYGFYSTGVGPSSSDSGVALPRPGALSQGGFGEFDFAMDLFLGASEH